MNVTGTGVGMNPQLQFAVAVEKKAQDSVREQGQQAIKLIEATGPQAPAGTGKHLHVVA